MAVTCDRYKFITVSFPERLRNVRFASETATWIQEWLGISAGTSSPLCAKGDPIFRVLRDGPQILEF
jgi:hypothetical protein